MLCDDFDDGVPIGQHWSSVDLESANGFVKLDTAYSKSPPTSFFSQINQGSSPGSARLKQFLKNSDAKVHMECDMLLQPSAGNFELFVLHLQPLSGETFGVFYDLQDGKLVVFVKSLLPDGGTFKPPTRNLGAPIAQWMHVEIDIEIAEHGKIVVKHGADVVMNELDVNTSTTRDQTFVELGLYSFTPTSGGGSANFDNVVIRAE